MGKLIVSPLSVSLFTEHDCSRKWKASFALWEDFNCFYISVVLNWQKKTCTKRNKILRIFSCAARKDMTEYNRDMKTTCWKDVSVPVVVISPPLQQRHPLQPKHFTFNLINYTVSNVSDGTYTKHWGNEYSSQILKHQGSWWLSLHEIHLSHFFGRYKSMIIFFRCFNGWTL